MPYKSKAQMRWMYAAEGRGEVPKGTAAKWKNETPNLKDLRERKKSKKEGIKSLTKKGSFFDNVKGTWQDTKNVLWGDNNLSRLRSWNNISSYLPRSLRDHVDRKHINPAVREAVNNMGLKGLGLLGTAGLAGYGLYRAFRKPPKQNIPARNRDPSAVITERSTDSRTVNDLLGLAACGTKPR